jgi:trigger factor
MARDHAHAAPRERKFTVRVESPGECKRLLRIEVPWEELAAEEARVAEELRHDVKVPGFRKGKVPQKYVEKNFGDTIRSEAVRNLLPAVYEDALVREGIAPIGEPRFDNVKTDEGKPITMDVTVEVRPDPTISGYKGIKVKVEKKSIDDDAVDETLGQMREQMSTLKVVDRPIKENDTVIVDYGPVMDDGEVDKERLATNYPIDLSRGNLLPEFHEGLLRLSTGEETEITVNYPDDFPEQENAGKTKRFHVRVKEIKEREMPEINDEFAQQLGGKFQNVAELRERLKKDLIEDEDKRFEHNAEQKIVDQLIDKNPFEVPDAMVENYLASVLEEDRKRRPQVPDEKQRVEEINQHFREVAVRTIKKYFILEAIKKQENIALDDKEVESKIEELVGDSTDRADEIRAYFRHPEHRRSLESDLLDRKVMGFLKENAQIKVA